MTFRSSLRSLLPSRKARASVIVATSLAVDAAGIAAQLAPLPWLATAATIVGQIMTLCGNVETNRQTTRQLGQRCHHLLDTIAHHHRKQAGKTIEQLPENLRESVQLLESSLDFVLEKAKDWKDQDYIIRFATQKNIADDTKTCHAKITICIEAFQIDATLQSLKWQTTFEENYEKDMGEIKQILSQIAQGHDKTLKLLEPFTRLSLDNQEQFLDNMDKWSNDATGTVREGLMKSRNEVAAFERPHGDIPSLELQDKEVQDYEFAVIRSNRDWISQKALYRGKVVEKVTLQHHLRTPKNIQRFEDEMHIRQVIDAIDKGKHLVPLLGYHGEDFYFITEYMKNGTADVWVKNDDCDVKYIPFLKDIAQGIAVLHGKKIIHGHIKGSTILVNAKGRPLLSDFGLTRMLDDSDKVIANSRGMHDSQRWCAPEQDVGWISFKSDVWQWAMTAWELFTHSVPFPDLHQNKTSQHVIEGGRPIRPRSPDIIRRGLDDDVWKLLEDCWCADADDRPTIREVIARLDNI